MREILLVPWSFDRHLMSNAHHWLETIDPASDTVLIFQDFDKYCEAANLTDTYQTILSGLRRRGIPTKTLHQDGLDQFLLVRNSNTPLYTTPLNKTECVVTSAVTCGYTGEIIAIGCHPLPTRDLTPLIRASSQSPRCGIRGLDKTAIKPRYTEGAVCHYTINGQYVEQVVKRGGLGGNEGFIMKSTIDGFVLKIWDIDRFQHANDKIEEMLKVDPNDDIALPLAFVYNAKEEPIGIVMRFFEGKTTTLDQLYRFPNPLKLCKDILRQLIWLESRSFQHFDIWHNVHVDASGAHLIDIDSVQYAGYPATATSQDMVSYIPACFYRTAAYGSIISTTYSTLSMLIQLYLDRDGYNRLLWDSKRQCDTIDQSMLQQLPPSLQDMVVEAYQNKRPVSLVRQLKFVEEEDASVRMHEHIATESAGQTGATPPIYEEYPEEDEPFEAPDYSHIQNSYVPRTRPVARRAARCASKPWFVRLMQKLIIWLCGGMSGTIPHSYGSPADPWDAFVRSRVWRKPLVYTIVGCVVVLVLLIAILSI